MSSLRRLRRTRFIAGTCLIVLEDEVVESPHIELTTLFTKDAFRHETMDILHFALRYRTISFDAQLSPENEALPHRSFELLAIRAAIVGVEMIVCYSPML